MNRLIIPGTVVAAQSEQQRTLAQRGTTSSMSTCTTEVAPEADVTIVTAPTLKAVSSPATLPTQRIYYGWIMLPLAMAALIASSPGQTFGVSIFNEPMRLSLGLSHGQLAAAYMLGTLLGALPIYWVGQLMDRYGLRRSMLCAVTLFCTACVLLSFVQGWGTLVIGFFLLRSLGPGTLAFLSGNTLPFWFERRLGTVEGVRQLGMAASMVVIPVLNLWLVTQFGWRGAYTLLGAVIWVCLFPIIYFCFRENPAAVGQQIDGVGLRPGDGSQGAKHSGSSDILTGGFTLGEALRTASFWIVTAGMVMFAMIHTAVFFCLVPIFEEHGLSGADAALTLMTFAAAMAVMQLVGGMMADRLPSPPLLFVGLLGLAGGVLLLQVAESRGVAAGAGILLGASQGVFFGAVHPLWARYFGRRNIGKIRGLLMTINVGFSSLGPLVAGLSRDWLGSFDTAMILFVLMPLPVAVLSWWATAPVPREPEMLVPSPAERLVPAEA